MKSIKLTLSQSAKRIRDLELQLEMAGARIRSLEQAFARWQRDRALFLEIRLPGEKRYL